MTLTAEQYAQMAARFGEAATDPQVPSDMKEEFTRKAEWFRFLADRERDKRNLLRAAGASHATPHLDPVDPPTTRMRPLIPALWATGAVLYLLSTLALVSVFFSSQEEGAQEAASQSPVRAQLPAERGFREGTIEVERKQFSPTAQTKHAISPYRPAYEAPGLAIPSQPTTNVPEPLKPDTIPTASDRSQAPLDSSETTSQSAEMLEVKTHAIIRSGPSTSAKKIGTATPGAALEVKARDGQWLQFVDPSSGNMGWIHSTMVAAADDALDNEVHADAPPTAVAPKPKVAKGKTSQSKEKLRRDRSVTADGSKALADLPYDEEFMGPRGPRLGLRARKRMLREGLLSPHFTPP